MSGDKWLEIYEGNKSFPTGIHVTIFRIIFIFSCFRINGRESEALEACGAGNEEKIDQYVDVLGHL